MKLDFSALAQPAEKTRGQLGTPGTQAFMRVCVSPLGEPDAGTSGDTPAAAALVADLLVAIATPCPPLSPACPQAAEPEKLNAGAVSPVSPLVPVENVQVAAAAPCECEDLAGEPTGASVNTCAACLHLGPRGTCLEPVAAGLRTEQEGLGIAWPDEGQAATCPAFSAMAPELAQKRPHKLTPEQLHAAHAEPWSEAVIVRFQARTATIQRHGFAEQDAEDLAERLHLRDRQADDRHMCLECRDLESTGRCAAARRGDIPGADRRMEPVQTILMRCHAFQPTLRARANQEGTDDADHHG